MAIQQHFTQRGSWCIVPHFRKEMLGECISNERAIVEVAQEHPIIFSRHIRQRHVVVGPVEVARFKSVRLLWVTSRGRSSDLNANLPVVVRGCIRHEVLKPRTIVQYLQIRCDLILLHNGLLIRFDEENRQHRRLQFHRSRIHGTDVHGPGLPAITPQLEINQRSRLQIEDRNQGEISGARIVVTKDLLQLRARRAGPNSQSRIVQLTEAFGGKQQTS